MDFSLEIINPRGIYLTKIVSSLTIKLTSGYRTILAGHMDLIGALDYAPMHIISEGKTEYFAIHGGAINITKTKVTIICNAIESASEIDLSRAEASKGRAQKRLQEKDPNFDEKRIRLSLARALARIKTAQYK